MRLSNFKMGSILPEHNNYKIAGLENINSNTIGLFKNVNNFKQYPRRQSPANKMQDISAGNNIAKGFGSFRTVNQEMTNWIQPRTIK